MRKRAIGSFLALVAIGVLWRFGEVAGTEVWALAAGSVALAGMAAALVFVRADRAEPAPLSIGIATFAAGIALAVAIVAVPGGGAPADGTAGEGDASPAVLCEIILDESDASRALAASASGLRADGSAPLIIIAYRAGGFLRAGLAEYDPPLGAPAALVDGVLLGRNDDLASAIARARTRPRPAVRPAFIREGGAARVVLESDEAEPVRADLVALALRSQRITGADLPVAQGSLRPESIPTDPDRSFDAVAALAVADFVEAAAVDPVR
ncbi:MAG: hypothetical protein JXP34_05900 [Planctomycetes bacterium]|nr:hypothetical protein [Planctomycetota bacterium]